MDLKFPPPDDGVKFATKLLFPMVPANSSSSQQPASQAIHSRSPQTDPQGQVAARKRKRTRWSSGPGSSADELAIAEAMSSFSDPSITSAASSQQNLTTEQQMQLKEQIEVCLVSSPHKSLPVYCIIRNK